MQFSFRTFDPFLPFRLISLLSHYFWRLYIAIMWKAFNWHRNFQQANAFYCLCFLLIASIINLFYFYKIESHHFVLLSTTFYSNSSIYEPNTAVILMNGPDQIRSRNMKSLICTATNGTSKRTNAMTIQYAYPPVGRHCKWTLYMAICRALPNPSEIFLSDSADSAGFSANIPFRLPYAARKMSVIACFSPFFYMERWQIVLSSLEIYKFFGVQLSVIYIQSILKEIMDVLEIYREKGFIELEPWSSIRLDTTSQKAIGFDPNNELDWRNQASSHTDCLFKYREATQFIIVGDIDDVLIPVAKSYIDEFSLFSSVYYNAAGFIYKRFNTELKSALSSENYSLRHLIKSAQISNKEETGKYVLNTSRVKTAWLHWPGIIVGNSKMYTIATKANIMLHLRNWTMVVDKPNKMDNDHWDESEEKNWRTSDFFNTNKRLLQRIFSANQTGKKHSSIRLTQFIQSQTIAKLEEEFVKMRSSYPKLFQRLPITQNYLPLIVACYDEIFYSRNKRPNFCPGPIKCKLPKIAGLNCSVANSDILTSHKLSWRTITHFSQRPANFQLQMDGCSL